MIRIAERLADQDVKYGGKAIRIGGLLNALTAWFLGLGVPEQDRIAVEGLEAFQGLREADPSSVGGELHFATRAGGKLLEGVTNRQSKDRIVSKDRLPKRR